MEPSPAIEQLVREHTNKLERLCPRITSCHVTIASPHRHKTHGREFRVRIELDLPGEGMLVAGEHGHDDAYAAVHAAFDHAVRRLSHAHRGPDARH